MKKITFVDLNKSLVSKVKKLFDENKGNKRNIEFDTHCGDIIKYQKKNGGYIATASNPNFTMGGGLDAVLKSNFPDEVNNCKEFSFSDNLFFTITVDENIETNSSIITRALIGCFGYASKNIIISGFGTGIGGMSEDDFLIVLQRVVSANLGSANLGSADLGYANLGSANLGYADLRYANLRYANLGSANLGYANLRYANLGSANLGYANLGSANLGYAKIENVKYDEGTAFFALTCPEEGDFIAYKKVNNSIVKLLIPAEAKRSSATTRKCRAEFADVLEIIDNNGKKLKSITNNNYVSCKYIVGKRVFPDSYDDDRWNECSNGIHFFITKQEAINWN